MSKIPTAEEVAIKIFPGDEESGFSFQSFNKTSKSLIKKAMIEYAKLHVQAALQAAAEQANLIGKTAHNNNAPDVGAESVYVVDSNGPDYIYSVDKETILDAYPDERIK